MMVQTKMANEIDIIGKQNGDKHVSNLLRTNNLDQIKKSKQMSLNKKKSGEAMLKTTMQTKMDNAHKGVLKLANTSANVAEIQEGMNKIEEDLSNALILAERMKSLREEAMKYAQYAAANDMRLSNVPQNVEKTSKYIDEGNLLEAHLHLMELEKSRDDLLFEMHKFSSTSNNDKSMAKHHFADVEKLSEKLGKQLWYIIRLTLNSARKEPSIIVSALRIIQREEKLDELAAKRQEETGFMSPGRPKNWKKRVFETLEEAASERIVGNQSEERSQTTMWLVRHLEVTRQLILEDLRVTKKACVSCFPPSYNIVSKMTQLYHRSLSIHLQDLAQQLEGNEYVTLLNWVQNYEGPDLLQHPTLNIDLKAEGLEPLLPKSVIEDLTNKYLATIEKNYKEWMSNTINRENRDWAGDNMPESDDSGYYQTTTPVIVFQMIDQHLQVAKTVDQELITRVLIMSLNHLAMFASQYKDAVRKYCDSHFPDRAQYLHYTPFMIAVCNNCDSFCDIARKFRRQYPAVSITDSNKSYENVLKSFENLREEMITNLMTELFMDLDKEIEKVGRKEWLEGSISVIENVCLTLEDYVRDYSHLKKRNFDLLKVSLEKCLAKSYITAILKKKMTFKDAHQREQFAKKFQEDGKTLRNAIEKLPDHQLIPATEKPKSPFDALPALAEFLRLKDLTLLYLEVSSIVQNYPDINTDHITALLSLREDMAKTNVRKQVIDMMPTNDEIRKSTKKTVFSEIIL